jgi:large subunit ribosomal protein L17
LNEKMVTTQAKAKAVIPVFDRLVIKARKNSEMNAIRELKKIVYGEAAQKKFMEEILPKLEGRPSGFTRTIKIGYRTGDNAPAVRIEILSNETKESPAVEAPASETTEA